MDIPFIVRNYLTKARAYLATWLEGAPTHPQFLLLILFTFLTAAWPIAFAVVGLAVVMGLGLSTPWYLVVILYATAGKLGHMLYNLTDYVETLKAAHKGTLRELDAMRHRYEGEYIYPYLEGGIRPIRWNTAGGERYLDPEVDGFLHLRPPG